MPPTYPQYPKNDRYPEPPPVDWVPIMLGPGQDPAGTAYGHSGIWEWDTSANAGTTVDPLSVRRTDEPIIIISRVPERW